jgi:hypothetical protein
MNNKTIDQSIAEVEQKAIDQQEQIDWTQKFYLNYTSTEYAPYFLGHESGQLYPGERQLRLKWRTDESETLPSNNETTQSLSPQDSRNFFLQTRLDELGF